MTRKKMISVIAILITVFVFSGVGCRDSGTDQAERPDSELFSKDPSSFDAKFDEIKKSADEKAKAWQSNAKLVYVSSEIPTNFNPDLVQHTFVYDSPAYPNDHWTVTIEVGNNASIRALIPKDDYLGSSPQQILPVFWKTNFATALQKSYNEGGSEIVSQNPNNFKIELNLARTQEENLRWVCKYSSLDSSQEKEIKIDANSGETIQ